MEDKTKIQLTSAEMSGLWTQYLSDTLAVCVGSYFLEKVEDEEVRPALLAAAADLYGSTSTQYNAVKSAWTQVGVN